MKAWQIELSEEPFRKGVVVARIDSRRPWLAKIITRVLVWALGNPISTEIDGDGRRVYTWVRA